MQFLPNIEIVTLLIILYTRTFGKRVFAIIYAFVMLEGLFLRIWHLVGQLSVYMEYFRSGRAADQKRFCNFVEHDLRDLRTVLWFSVRNPLFCNRRSGSGGGVLGSRALF